jgi:hypothetical protein
MPPGTFCLSVTTRYRQYSMMAIAATLIKNVISIFMSFSLIYLLHRKKYTGYSENFKLFIFFYPFSRSQGREPLSALAQVQRQSHLPHHGLEILGRDLHLDEPAVGPFLDLRTLAFDGDEAVDLVIGLDIEGDW